MTGPSQSHRQRQIDPQRNCVSYSLNETHKLVKDAARGAGWPWGDADDIARVAVWLEVAGASGLAFAADTFDRKIGTVSDIFSARDGLTTGDTQTVTCHLLPLIAILSLLADDLEQAFAISRMSGPQHIAHISPNGTAACQAEFTPATNAPRDAALDSWSIDVTTHRQPPDMMTIMSPTIRRSAVETGLHLDSEARSRLEEHARKTLVEATAASRLRGAGAGTVDCD
ncbi:MAG: DUF3726 domain-containing protein [Pseudomonadota bacterium]